MSKLDDQTLQRLYDGDLEGEQRAEAEARLADSAEDRQRLASLEQLGSLMRENLGAAAEQAPLDGLWESVRARLDAPGASPEAAPEATPAAATTAEPAATPAAATTAEPAATPTAATAATTAEPAVAPTTAPAATPERASAMERLRGWLAASMGVHPLRWVGAGAAVAAAAVALTLLLVPGDAPEAPRKSPVAKEAPSDDVTIKELDAPQRHPDVYQIKDGMRVTTVIWVHDDDEYEEDDPNPNGAPDGDDI